MSSINLTSNTLEVSPSPGEIEYNGQFHATDGNSSRAPLQRLVQETAVASTSGTAIDFTGIPSWVKRITVMFNGVSVSGASQVIVQIGDSGGIETTGYSTYYAFVGASTVAGNNANTNGFSVGNNFTAAEARSGHLILTNISGNTWIYSTVVGAASVGIGGGTKTLSATLDRIRIASQNGTDTFDAGSINILYEG